MALAKRILLFLALNILVVTTISFILELLNVRPYLSQYGLEYKDLMIFCLVWGMGGALISLSLSRIMAKMMMGVRVIDPDSAITQQRQLVNTVHMLARNAHLTEMPQVGIYDSPELNAFATGPTQKRSLVAVSTGLLNRMSQNELEGVLAHEICHITNGDMVTMTLVQGVVNAFVMFLARVLAYVVSGLAQQSKEKSSERSYFAYSMLVFVFEFAFMILGSIVIATYSRFREFRADKGGSHLAGKEKMIAALEALQRNIQIKDEAHQKPAFQAFKISNRKHHGLGMLFATHPPLDDRIERLKNEF
jgi:heat shock protein HtpX